MSTKVILGVCRKIGQPDYGSIGASCNVELELESSLLQRDFNGFHEYVRQAYAACQQAVDDQLDRHQQVNGPATSAHPGRASRASAETQSRPESQADPSMGNGHNGNGGRPATEKQLTYIRQLSGQIKGLGVRRLDTLADNMFGKPVAGLSSLDASGLIDCLKGIKTGEIDVQAALNGAAL